MIRLTWSASLWFLSYLLVLIAPLVGGIFNLAHGRGFWLNFSIALGLVALSIFGAQFLTTLRMRLVAQPVGILANFVMHRVMAYIGTAFALLHVALLFILDKKYWALLDITTSPMRAKFAVGATVALLLLVTLSTFRSQFGMRYKMWHQLHWLLALVVFGGALAHAVLVNYYLKDQAEQIVWVSLGTIFVAAALWTRFVNPYLRWRRRWRVTSVDVSQTDFTELWLEPVHRNAWGGKGFTFRAGQFAWMVAGRSPFAISANPFSIASSAMNPWALRFMVRANQGHSAALQTLQIGTHVYLDGPHGTFTPSPTRTGALILIGAGIGVTPLLAMAETLADSASRRPVVIMLSNRSEESVLGKKAVEALKPRLNLVLHHVYSSNNTRMDERFIRSHLPPDTHDCECFICGGTPFMDMAEAALHAAGIAPQQVHTERFSMV